MASLSDIVQVTVSTLTTQIKQPGFGVPLIADFHAVFPERVRFYTDLTGMLSDGFTVNSGAYLAASQAFAQSPQLAKLAIGRRALAPDSQVDLTPVVLNSTLYSVKVRGPAGITGTASFTSDGTATAAEIVAGLVSAINALAAGVTATDQATFVRVKAPVAGQWFSVEVVDLARISAKQNHADPGIATDLAAINLENSDWYGLTLSTQGAPEILAAAAWVESNKKLMLQASQDGDILATTPTPDDIAKDLKDANYFRTALIFHPNPAQHAGAAWLGSTFPFDPGGLTFAFRKLAATNVVPLTATQVTNLKADNCNFFTDYGGVAITQEGKVAAGEWIDIIRDRDWYEARLQTLVYSVLINNPKVPFTDPGIGQIEAEVRKATREAVINGFLAEGTDTYIVPKASEVASVDKAARRLATIKVNAKVAGAIHVVQITATITV